MRGPNVTILTVRICAEIKRTGEMHSGATDETERAGIGENPPVPLGFQAAIVQCVERFARSPATRFIALLLAGAPLEKQN